MKKKIKIIVSLLVVGLFLFMAFGSGNDKGKVECDSKSEGYKKGYETGKHSPWDDPNTYIRECNNGYGMIGTLPPCWNEGFIDGYQNK